MNGHADAEEPSFADFRSHAVQQYTITVNENTLALVQETRQYFKLMLVNKK